MLVSGDMSLRGTYDAAPALTKALWLALLGGACFLIGYCTRGIPLGVATKPHGLTRRLAHTPTLAISMIFGLAAVLVTASAFGHGEVGSTAYIYYTPLLAVPVALLLLSVESGYRPLIRAVAFGIIAMVVVNYWAVGNRFFGLLPIAAVVVLFYLRHNRRPRLVSVLVAVVVLAGVLALLLNQRVHTSSTPTPAAQRSLAGRFVLGGTTEELPAFAVEINTKGQLWSTRPGYLLYSTAVNWIPSKLWANKPKSYAELLYASLFPANYRVTRNGTEFSVLGDFYYDSGPIGVAVGMLVLGLFCRFLFERLGRYSRGGLSAVAYAPVPALMVPMLRGDFTLVLGLALYVYAPIGLAAVVVNQRMRRHVVVTA